MGVCAQHDLLWDEMTGKEHLEFFCRFKGIPRESVEREAAHRLEVIVIIYLYLCMSLIIGLVGGSYGCWKCAYFCVQRWRKT